jgi:protein LTV1
LEEKKARKNAIKELKRERRLEKKVNKLAFKEEKSRQEKIGLNASKTLQGLKLL